MFPVQTGLMERVESHSGALILGASMEAWVMDVLSWGLPGTVQTGHTLISRQGLVAGTSILVFVLFWGLWRIGCALTEE